MNIFALSSGKGPSGIAIVRISGPQTLNICKSLTNEKNIKSNEINLCKFIDPKITKLLILKHYFCGFLNPIVSQEMI